MQLQYAEFLSCAVGLAGAGMLEVVPDKHLFGWVLIVLAAVILISGVRIDGWHIRRDPPIGWRAKMTAWLPWFLIVGGPLVGGLLLFLAPCLGPTKLSITNSPLLTASLVVLPNLS